MSKQLMAGQYGNKKGGVPHGHTRRIVIAILNNIWGSIENGPLATIRQAHSHSSGDNHTMSDARAVTYITKVQ